MVGSGRRAFDGIFIYRRGASVRAFAGSAQEAVDFPHRVLRWVFDFDSRPPAVVHGKYFDSDPALSLAQRDEGTDTSIAVVGCGAVSKSGGNIFVRFLHRKHCCFQCPVRQSLTEIGATHIGVGFGIVLVRAIFAGWS
jgi:hypothetical protein